jgi:hypothetical protein
VTSRIEVADVGIGGRLVPDDVELLAIVAAVTITLRPSGPQRSQARVPSWRFASRTWGKHAALLRTRPHRPNSF